MFDHRWFPWINGPTPAPIPMTDKKEPEQSSESLPPKPLLCHHMYPMMLLSALCVLLLVICITLSVMYTDQCSSKLERSHILFDYQNITKNYISMTTINSDLKRDNKILMDHNAGLEEQNKLLNKTLVKLLSQDLAMTKERAKLMEKIDNLTSTNAHLTDEYSKVVQVSIDQEETMENMSRTIADLSTFIHELQEGKQKLEEASRLLHDVNQKLQDKSMKEREMLQGMLEEVRGQNQNLTSASEKQRTDLNLCKEELTKMSARLQSGVKAYHSLDRYCPVVNQNTEERLCKKCAEGWTWFQSKCYYFSSRALSWSSSRAWCQTHRANLVIINSEKEQNFTHETSHRMDQTNTRLWIGMSDIEQEGDWRWVDGRQVTSSPQYWLDRPGVGTEPDDWRSEDAEGEDCGHVDTSEEVLQSWMDGSCKISYRWVCEMNV